LKFAEISFGLQRQQTTQLPDIMDFKPVKPPAKEKAPAAHGCKGLKYGVISYLEPVRKEKPGTLL